MADEVVKPTAIEVQGAKASDLDDGQGTGGAPKAPEAVNTPPVKEPTAEEKAATEKKAADDKAAEDAALKTKEDEAALEDTTQEDAGPKDFAKYDDEAAQAVISVLKDAGVTPKEADSYFSKAVQSGKLEDIDVAGLTAKVGKEKASLVLIGAKDYYNRNMAATKEVVEAAYTEVGGQENYTKVRDYFRKAVETKPELESTLKEWNQMFDLNKKTALVAVKEMVKLYNEDPKNRSLQIRMVEGDTAATSTSDGEKLSRNDYLAKVKVAQDKRDFEEVARLRAVRAASRR